MHEEWLNSIPFIEPNCYYNNISEYRKAEKYYKENCNCKMERYYREKAEKEEEKLAKIKLYEKKHPIISKFIKIDDLI